MDSLTSDRRSAEASEFATHSRPGPRAARSRSFAARSHHETSQPAAASANALDDIKAAKKIRVGIDLGAPFYGYIDDKMQAVGSDVEAARLLAQDLGVELDSARKRLAAFPDREREWARLNRQFLLGARNQAFVTEYVSGMATVKSLQTEPLLERLAAAQQARGPLKADI